MLRRVHKAVLAGFLLFAVGSAAQAQGTFEANTNRPGGDITRFPVGPNPLDCQKACVAERRCVAWTYDQRAMVCWLKGAAQRPRPQAGAISGVVSRAAPRPATLPPGPAPVQNAAATPGLSPACNTLYGTYLKKRGPKAFAVSPDNRQCSYASEKANLQTAISRAHHICAVKAGMACAVRDQAAR